jgi:hypothetical protein
MPITQLDENQMLELTTKTLCYHCMYEISKAYNNLLQIGWDKLEAMHKSRLALDTVKDGWKI